MIQLSIKESFVADEDSSHLNFLCAHMTLASLTWNRISRADVTSSFHSTVGADLETERSTVGEQIVLDCTFLHPSQFNLEFSSGLHFEWR